MNVVEPKRIKEVTFISRLSWRDWTRYTSNWLRKGAPSATRPPSMRFRDWARSFSVFGVVCAATVCMAGILIMRVIYFRGTETGIEVWAAACSLGYGRFAVLAVGSCLALQQVIRRFTEHREATKRNMREQTLAHLYEKLNDFRTRETNLRETLDAMASPTAPERVAAVDLIEHDDEGKTVPLTTDAVDYIWNDHDLRSDARAMLDAFEQVGTGVARGVLGFVTTDAIAGPFIVDVWRRWQPFAVRRREKRAFHMCAYDQLQWLAACIVHWRCLNPNIDHEAHLRWLALRGDPAFELRPNGAYEGRRDANLWHLLQLIQIEAFDYAAQRTRGRIQTGEVESPRRRTPLLRMLHNWNRWRRARKASRDSTTD